MSREQCQRRTGRRPPLRFEVWPDRAPEDLLALLCAVRTHALMV